MEKQERLIRKILTELYSLDEELREKEEELKKLIRDLLDARPEIKPDENFEAELRAQLFEKIAQMKKNWAAEKIINPVQKSWPNKLSGLNFMKKINYALAGAVLCAVFLLGGVYLASKNGLLIGRLNLGFRSDEGATRLADGAFGSLRSEDQNLTASEGAGAGGGGQKNEFSTAAAPMVEGRGGGGYAGVSPYFTNFKYVYAGDDFELTEDKVAVHKRVTGGSSSFSNLLRSLNFSFVDLGFFAGANLETLNFSEDRDFGYAIFIDLKNENVSISENWTWWQKFNPTANCRDESCYQQNRLNIGDIPADDTLISLARQFLGQIGIDSAKYGEPEINQEWRVYYEQSKDQNAYMVPEAMQVIFPLLVDGQRVYEAGGTGYGLTVNVNTRHQKVSGVWNLSSRNYASSMYPAETDKNKILQFAEKGGLYSYDYPGGQTKEVQIGTPQTALMSYWKYNSTNHTNDELLVPALIFPVLKDSADETVYKNNIVVPLVKDLLNEQNNDVVPLRSE